MQIAVKPQKSSMIRAIAGANPDMSEYQVAGEMRLRGHRQVLASEVRSALRPQLRRPKAVGPASLIR